LWGLKYGIAYLSSEKFQAYGDESKAAWTCHVNKIFAEFNIMFSRYKVGQEYYIRLLKRCPEGSLAEKASYQIAYCYEKMGQLDVAINHFEQFIEDYPNSERTKKLPKKLQRLDSNR